MAHRVLITGASGYLGGDLLARLPSANLPSLEKLYALVRTDAQAEAVKKYAAEPLRFNVRDSEEVRDALLKNGITVVFFLIDAMHSVAQVNFIDALAEVKKATGKEVHLLHTTGAKLFSSLSGTPTDYPILDTDPELYNIQKEQNSAFQAMNEATRTNNAVIERAESQGVRAYIFAPCIVYGKSEGFGNPISIQTVAIVKAAKAAGGIFSPNAGAFSWPVCHISDNSGLYISILRSVVAGKEIGSGKNGYYLASPGSVAWNDLYSAMAQALAKRKVIQDATVKQATDEDLTKMASGLGCAKDFVLVQLGGHCTYTATHGKEIGWEPKYSAEHIIDTADAEVELILANLKD